MKAQLLILSFLSLFVANSCNKEVGKEKYMLKLNFNDNCVKNIDCVIYEKSKEYETEAGDKYNMLGNPNFIKVVAGNSSDTEYFVFHFVKTEANYLASINLLNNMTINNAAFASNQNITINGVCNLNGSYKKKGKKFIVENGTFTINWSNAPDYGEPVQELTGTWSLKRK